MNKQKYFLPFNEGDWLHFQGKQLYHFHICLLISGVYSKRKQLAPQEATSLLYRFILVRSGCPGKQTVLPYFFGYKTGFFPFQNNSKNLDPSYKMALDIWDCLGRIELEIS